jgi:hypothetical protein
MQTLYVDTLSQDGSYGMTMNHRTAYFNVEKIQPNSMDNLARTLNAENAIVRFYALKNYLCTLYMSLDDSECFMQFIDLKDDDDEALKFASTFDGDDKARCYATYEMIKSKEFKLSQALLIIGSPSNL